MANDRRKLFFGAALSSMLAVSCDHGSSMEEPVAKDAKKGHCYNVNSCKGTGACGGDGHSCAGKNQCKGKGFLKMTKEECEKKGGKFKAH